MDFFRAFQAKGTGVPMYFIESTAPNNVDDLTSSDATRLPDELVLVDPVDRVIDMIAAQLAGDESQPNPEPNLVVMVHGFNNPRTSVLDTYVLAATAVRADPAIKGRPGLVCVGYRWPSEKMGQPWRASASALPTLAIWVFVLGLALIALAALFFSVQLTGYDAAAVVAGFVLAGLVATAVLLRVIVYFRDNFRAIYYGIPDLMQIIRTLDGALAKRRGANARRVQLSFVGHSMGAVVVTNTLRTLSDLFKYHPDALSSCGATTYDPKMSDDPASREIGASFELKRFVLASPDIPAEALLSSRGNFLASTLVRFEEAYLFTNEGDEVLRQISTLANYFSFPSNSRNYGFRLGNVEVLSRDYGLLSFPSDELLDHLRVGSRTIQKLYDDMQAAGRHRQAASKTQTNTIRPPEQPPLPMHFSYFDCTDYIDRRTRTPADILGPGPAADQPLLTFALKKKRKDASARLRWYSHLRLLRAYIGKLTPNVHGGYFEGELGRQLIFRLACLGYRDTVKAFGGRRRLSALCAERQIRVLLSPRLPQR